MDLIFKSYGLPINGIRGCIQSELAGVPYAVAIRGRVILDLNSFAYKALCFISKNLIEDL